MKNIHSYLIFILLITAACSCNKREEVKQHAATENFPNDSILNTTEKKKAMIVIAHDDDMCAMAGTAALLNKNGWEIAVISFTRTPERDAAHIQACRNFLDTVLFVNLSPTQIRNDAAEERKYIALPKDSFDIIFNKPLIEAEYLKQVQQFDPAIIFTLDNELGAYGHPEHVLVSQMVIDWATKKDISPLYIYQSVYTDHMENSIMDRHSKRMKSWGFPGDEWEHAKKIYGVTGMPEPTVQINITSQAQIKMDYLRSYNERERKTLGFFVPEFEKYDAEEYFTIFNREFFRVIKIEQDAKTI